MHATKSFAVGEAGLIYSADTDRIARLRTMSSFGFGEPRTATMAGLNGKLSEVNALLGRLRLADYDSITGTPGGIAESLSQQRLSEPGFPTAERQASRCISFVPASLPSALKGKSARSKRS